ncbi:hypothetical protein AXF42_Ash003918 [Apostasia shenzhenica]|uniref:Stress up-regulated Nod 19 protein n=1 Tax=Apostasia shenzhenica TaxID=1088818 RepID=A0A2I0AIB8_9ASPA|nr:hypothetical protein AXF42_Ash003918 [Apostasia shenzhenica]
MFHRQLHVPLLTVLISSTCFVTPRLAEGEGISVKTSVFLSPPFFLHPGSVVNTYYFDIPFPRGHIALKTFNGEVIDENGNPVPLHETYLHHWVVERYYGQKGIKDEPGSSKFILVRNSGICKNTLRQYYGLGSETRKTDTWVPDPYGIEAGNPEVPDGYEEKWLLNVHAIDTRGVEDRLGCTECKCSLYNVTVDEFGQPLPEGYIGGLRCCYDRTQCRTKPDFTGIMRKLYLRYTVKWVEWVASVVPLEIYIFDVTDTGQYPSGLQASSSCKVEYMVSPCDSLSSYDCVNVKKTKVALPRGGDIVYGVAHQHTGGIGSALYSEDGRLLCTSIPLYGNGDTAGDEAGYIVGMSTCYPKPGSANIKNGEILTVVSNYSSAQMHTGVMGLFYVLVAEPRNAFLSQRLRDPWFIELEDNWWVLLLAGGLVALIAAFIHRRRNGREDYQLVFN